jgi:hypothetical protein
MTCDTKFTGHPKFENLTADKVITKNITSQWGVVEMNGNIKLEGHVEIPKIEWDIRIEDKLTVPDVNVTVKVETPVLRVSHDTYLGGNTYIDGPVTYRDRNDSAAEPVCLDNAIKNLFRPSWWMFKLSGSMHANGEPNGTCWGIGSNIIKTFNDNQDNPVSVKTVGDSDNQTELEWIKDFWWTPWVFVTNIPWVGKTVVIKGDGADAGIYQVNYNLTVKIQDFDAQTKNNITSARSGLVIYDIANPKSGYIIDDKFHPEKDSFEFEWQHSHGFYDDSYPSGSNDTTNPATLYFRSYPMDNLANGHAQNPPFKSYVARSLGYYTFTVSTLIWVKDYVAVAPFIKLASGIAGGTQSYKLDITTGVWNTGGQSSFSVHKIANLWQPFEYHCWRDN